MKNEKGKNRNGAFAIAVGTVRPCHALIFDFEF
jgi:hypothetical protein